MTTLKNLLEQVKIGKDVFEENIKVQYFAEAVDSDYNLFLASKVIYDKMDTIEEQFHTPLKSIAYKISQVEEKLLEGKSISKAYGMIKADGIAKDYNKIMQVLAEGRKLYNKLDKKNLADVFATIRIALNNICEDINYQKSVNKAYGVLESYIVDSEKLITESLDQVL